MNESPFVLKQCPECGSEKLIPVGSPRTNQGLST